MMFLLTDAHPMRTVLKERHFVACLLVSPYVIASSHRRLASRMASTWTGRRAHCLAMCLAAVAASVKMTTRWIGRAKIPARITHVRSGPRVCLPYLPIGARPSSCGRRAPSEPACTCRGTPPTPGDQSDPSCLPHTLALAYTLPSTNFNWSPDFLSTRPDRPGVY